jgi:hypothetical protein
MANLTSIRSTHKIKEQANALIGEFLGGQQIGGFVLGSPTRLTHE